MFQGVFKFGHALHNRSPEKYKLRECQQAHLVSFTLAVRDRLLPIRDRPVIV